MPNYEIYPGDIVNVLQACAGTNQQVQLDSTDFSVKRTENKYEVFRDHLPVGHITFKIEGGVLSLGLLGVVVPYRGLGVSQVLVQLALVYGVLHAAAGARLSEQVVDNRAELFFANYRLQFREDPSSLSEALVGSEHAQDRLARKLGLARSPNTLLLNTDRPRAAVAAQRPRSRSIGK